MKPGYSDRTALAATDAMRRPEPGRRTLRYSFPIRAALLAAVLLAAVPGRAADMEDMGTAVLQCLDKVTGRVQEVEVPVGRTVNFGSLRITAEACRKAPPIEAPEAASFLEIDEVKPDEAAVRRFSGWMFASSPALSAMEHPVYDVWVLDCK
jgi:hypothetical protein